MKKELIMPSNSVALSTEEMMKVNGGEKYTYYLSNDDCKAACFAICGSMVGISASAVVAAADVAAITIAAFVPGMAGLTTAMVGGFAWSFAKCMTEVCMSKDKGLKIEYEYPLNLKFAVTSGPVSSGFKK